MGGDPCVTHNGSWETDGLHRTTSNDHGNHSRTHQRRPWFDQYSTDRGRMAHHEPIMDAHGYIGAPWTTVGYTREPWRFMDADDKPMSGNGYPWPTTGDQITPMLAHERPVDTLFITWDRHGQLLTTRYVDNESVLGS